MRTSLRTFIASLTSRLRGRERSASALHRSEDTYRQLFERHPAAMFVFDPVTWKFVAVNEAAVATYGYSREEFLALTVEGLRPLEDRETAHGAVAAPLRGHVVASERRHLRKDGTVIDVVVSSNDIEFDGKPARLVLAEDVTERRQLQRQLEQIHKMEALGLLAGGVAHDFNNLLTVISGFGDLALNELASEDSPARAHIAEVQRAVDRAAELTRQLLAYSRQQVLQKTSLDLNHVVRESETLLRRVIGEDIVVGMELSNDLGRVLADEGKFSQVLMNLAVNARDAMHTGGRLTIRTRNVQLDGAAAAELWGAPPGEYVIVEVSDTGTGMSAEVADHAFEPFFTTKPIGHGTGLGLSTVFGIVKQSDGYIRADSAVGAGTTFTIYLPRNETPVHSKPVSPSPAASGGHETILVVEDEPIVRELIEKMLSARGYTVLPTADPEEALRLSRAHEVDAIVSDVVMPAMRGPELVEELRRERPALRALFISGYPSDRALEQEVGRADVAFVQKPFTADELSSRLRQLLDT